MLCLRVVTGSLAGTRRALRMIPFAQIDQCDIGQDCQRGNRQYRNAGADAAGSGTRSHRLAAVSESIMMAARK